MTPTELRTRLSEAEQALKEAEEREARARMETWEARRAYDRALEAHDAVLARDRALNRAVVRRFGFERNAS